MHSGAGDDRAIVVRGFTASSALTCYGAVLGVFSGLGAVLSHSLAADQSSIFVQFTNPTSAAAALALGGPALAALLPGVSGTLVIERSKADPRVILPSSSTIV